MPGRGEFDVLYIGLNRDRKLLFESIEKGWANSSPEASLRKWNGCSSGGYDERFPSMQGFGYKDIVDYFRGKCSLEEAAERDISQTKAFSRRQMTWFGKFSPIIWYDTSVSPMPDLSGRIEKEVRAHLGK